MASERFDGLAAVLAAVRSDSASTQPHLVQRIGLGRSIIAQRVAELQTAGLLVDDGPGPSTGGRAPRRLRLRSEAGLVLAVDIAATELVVGLADLSGLLLATRQEAIDVDHGPEPVMAAAERLADELLARTGTTVPVWAIGAGVPGPVEFSTGLPIAPPIMRGWDRYPLRARLSARYGAPAWVDNDVNLLALGELKANPAAAAAEHLLYVRAGVGVGAGIVVDGRLYRGANGSAGDIGHVAIPGGGDALCRCGRTGCLEAVAGAAALVREGRLLAETGRSPALAATLAEKGEIRALDVTAAADDGDLEARAVLHRTAHLLGATLATLVSFHNPRLLVLGGGIARAHPYVLDAVRDAVHERSLPLSTQDLRIEVSAVPEEVAGVTGAVHLALDGVFSGDELARWLPHGSPAGPLQDVPSKT